MPRDRSKTYSDRQSDASRLGKPAQAARKQARKKGMPVGNITQPTPEAAPEAAQKKRRS